MSNDTNGYGPGHVHPSPPSCQVLEFRGWWNRILDAHYDREANLAKLVESKEVVLALRRHLDEIVEGEAFRASHRSGRFLRYIVEQAIAGHFDSLKERVIGAELFARSPSYDTGQDAIVRVAASDVRRRLLEHYDRCGAASRFRITVPQGSYIPEIACVSPSYLGSPESPPVQAAAPPPDPHTTHENRADTSSHLPGSALTPPAAHEAVPLQRPFPRQWIFLLLLLTISVLATLGLLGKRSLHTQSAQASVLPDAPTQILPWSAIFGSSRITHLITSDPDIFWIQKLSGNPISISDYANHIYFPANNTLSPEMTQFFSGSLRGDKAASVDVPIAVNIENLAQRSSKSIDVHTARNIQFSDLKTDDNFIFLGSSRSDPWISLFSDQLDFRFVVSRSSFDEVIRNVRPQPGEQLLFSQTAKGGSTGQSFAIIAFVRNPDQDGQVLLLAGLNAEGTRAAGKLVTDLPRLSKALQACGITSATPLRHFELLLRVKMMADTPSESDVIACHILPETSPR